MRKLKHIKEFNEYSIKEGLKYDLPENRFIIKLNGWIDFLDKGYNLGEVFEGSDKLFNIMEDFYKTKDEKVINERLKNILSLIKSYLIGKKNKDIQYKNIRDFIYSLNDIGKYQIYGQTTILYDITKEVLNIIKEYFNLDYI